MNGLIQILETLPAPLGGLLLKTLPFAGAGVIAAVVFLLLRRTAGEEPEHADGEAAVTKPDEPAAPAGKTGAERVPAPEKEREPAAANPLEKLRKGLSKSRDGLLFKLEKIVSGGKLNEGLWEEFEELLVLADTGVGAATKIRERVEKRLSRDELRDYGRVKNALMEETAEMLEKPARGVRREPNGSPGKPGVFMIVGVNGTGKTTTAGKLAGFMRARGGKVTLAAADTFRAAAAEQLEAWANRSGCCFIKGKPGADPSGVAFDAVKAGAAKNCDAVIIDTAGRLHTKTNLMDELSKIKRVVGKAREGGPEEVFLVLDATTGQNAIRQTLMFDEAVGVTGIILTKLDGTAKGGVLMAIAERFEIPVRYVGTGEGMDDIAEFDPRHFAAALFDETGRESGK